MRRTSLHPGDTAEQHRTAFIIIANADRVTDATLSVTELGSNLPIEQQKINNWSLLNQESAVDWRPSMLLMSGVRLRVGGFLGEYNSTKVGADDFTYAEQIAFGFVGSAASGIGTIVYQEDNGFSVGQWITKTPDGFVLADPSDPVLRETTGVVSRVVSPNSFIVESAGFGSDVYSTNIDQAWDYEPGTHLYLGADGLMTDIVPVGVPYRHLCSVWDYGYLNIDQHTVYPTSYQPEFDSAWPTDSQLRAAIGEGGFRVFYYLGAEPGRVIGCYLNPNAGNPSTTPISTPTKL